MVKVAIIIEDGQLTIYNSEEIELTIADLDTDDPEEYEEGLHLVDEIEEDDDYKFMATY